MRSRRVGWQTPSTLLLVLACLALAMLHSPAADTAPGDVADLAVTKTDSPDPVAVDGTLTFTIQVRNLGPQQATGVTLTDRLPNHTVLLSASSSQGTCGRRGRRVTCNIGHLAADVTGASAVTVTIQMRTPRLGSLRNSAFAQSVETDPVLANDVAETTTQVVAPQPESVCRGRPTTQAGTPGADLIFGTTGPDVIAGGDGDDVIVARSGRDLICSGSGLDRVNAGTAADRVFGGRGADRLLGRGGRDLLAGNPGADKLLGNRGRDRLRGGRGFDRCFGGGGVDRERGCER
jgi:uncharacterized repeat protein (TIGR01451 family)